MFKYWAILIAFLLIACKHQHPDHSHHVHDKNENTSPLYNEVMAIHDAVMPEMTTIHKLKKELKAIENPGAKSIILDNIKDLNDADEAMMTWMADFKVPDDKSQEESYLQAEKVKIQAVSDQMYGALKTAATLIDSLKSLPIK